MGSKMGSEKIKKLSTKQNTEQKLCRWKPEQVQAQEDIEQHYDIDGVTIWHGQVITASSPLAIIESQNNNSNNNQTDSSKK